MAINQQGIPYARFGNQVISFMGRQDVGKAFQGVMDNASLHSWYEQDSVEAHRGLITSWNALDPNYTKSIYDDLVMDKSVIEVNGMDGYFTYDTPVYEERGCYTEVDMSHQKYPGIDGAIFYITLNKEFAPGTVLLYDSFDGEQIFVAEEEEVINTGSGFQHPVKLVTNDRGTWFREDMLSKGIQYFAINHGVGEYGTKFAKLQMPEPVRSIKNEFRLGSTRGVEAAITAVADSKKLDIASAFAKDYLDKMRNEMDSCGYGEFAVRMDVDQKTGKAIKSTANIGSTIEFLVHKYLNQLTGTALLFQKAGTIKDKNGVIRLNEGLWHQIRRGFRITYGKAGGITKSHIKQAAEYIFRINPDLDYEKRVIKFKCGTEAFYNVLDLFKTEIELQNAQLAPLLGADRQIPNPVSGTDPLNLEYRAIRFTRVFIKEIGMVEITKDTALDRGLLQDRFSAGFHGNQRAHTTYSMIIWDASSSNYSNNSKDLPKNTSLVAGGNGRSNIYVVKPEGTMTYSGVINGRYDMRKSSDIVASHKTMGQEFWAYNNCSIWVEDPSKFVMIELERSERRGFN
jgi:hypothetical protein